MDCKKVYDEARAAATLAIANASDGLPCGFAWINIKPARGPFIKFLKDNKIGRKDDYYGGYTLSSYDACNWNGQNMIVKESACYAFADVLTAAGLKAHVQSRMD